MADTWVFFYLLGQKVVGYTDTIQGEMSRHEFEPFGDMPGYEAWGSAWYQSGADDVEEAVARLKDWMALIGLRGEPIVSDHIPLERPEPSEGWEASRVEAVVLDEMMNCGVLAEDIFREIEDPGPDDEDKKYRWEGDIVRWRHDDIYGVGHLRLGLRPDFPFPVLAQTTDEDIRAEVRRWAAQLRLYWRNAEALKEDARYIQHMKALLPATWAEWTEKARERDGHVSTAEAAEILGVSKDHVNLLCRQGKLRGARKAGWSWIIPRGAIDEYTPGPQGFAAHPEKNPRKRKGGQEPSEEP